MTVDQRYFEAVLQSKDLKVGQPLTQMEFDALEHLLGDIWKVARGMKAQSLGEIKFTEKGNPYTTDGNPNEISVDGKKPLNLHEGPL